jgi:hypothetical protein
MRRKRMRRMILAALIFTATAAIAIQASAGIHVYASVATPTARIQASTDPSCYYRIDIDRRLPARRYVGCRITRDDVRIAHRLAWFTGVPARKLIDVRRRGYSWFEIGRELRVHRNIVRAAFDGRSWNAFLQNGHRHDRRQKKYREEYRVTLYGEREYGRR